MIAQNLSAAHIVNLHQADGREARVDILKCATFLLERAPLTLTALYRGAPLVCDAAVNESLLLQMTHAMCVWLRSAERLSRP